MGLRVKPTYRQRRFGVEVRQLRERAGLSSTEAARLLVMKQPQLSNVESGKTGLSAARVSYLADAAGISNGPFVEALNEMGQDSGKGWWTEYRKELGESHLDLAELEAGAVALHNYELLFIPGLLQTADYATAVHGGGYAESVREVQDKAVEFRMARQRILSGDHPPKLHAIIHEAALRVLYGGREVMREQLLRLVEVSRLPNVTVQIIPLEDERRAAFNHSFMVIEPSVVELGTVLVDQLGTAQLLGDAQVTTEYEQSFARLSELALPAVDAEVVPEDRRVKDSLGLIQHLLYPLL
ncbi:helix-turn-helix domain-containing protein [Streptomyces zagrosensis]|uniref:Transcriptional regulator with XRE-family HTH domain n=1 Tax=Streptomyces zagrosensis TaxID=1042984 RepID=A0A7W9QAL8_9ACTN|nr:helix-turn-helix transcriptional regulator [Streptomyces zagrosensis]MBB5936713.1 transcriptional regulator with XRE-family HTH domain [Streptomyces zagrosensis]